MTTVSTRPSSSRSAGFRSSAPGSSPARSARHAARALEPTDALRWPDIVTVPHHPLRALAARRLFAHAVKELPLRVRFPDGTQMGLGTASDPIMVMHRPEDFYQRVGASGLIGFGESYMAGDWSADPADDAEYTDDAAALAPVLTVMAKEMASLVPAWAQRLRQFAVLRSPLSDDNTLDGSRTNISHHYDLSNELFQLFLDPTLSYSSAFFAGDPDHSAEPLADAQHRKIDRLLDDAGVTAGSRVLEIGTGWGELSLRAAARGARVTTVTLSKEQADLAAERVEAAGYAERVDIRLQDYREVTGQFDAIVSVEMIEAVGYPHWHEYFEALDRLLVPGGRVSLQAITMPHDRMLASLNTYTWILKYIFPGGQLPSVKAIHEEVDRTSLRLIGNDAMGLHYAETLRRWRETFEANSGAVDELGFDLVFRRMWSLYLAYSEAGFRSGYLDVNQITLAKGRS